MNIVIIGDSLILFRPEDDDIQFTDTYGGILKDKLKLLKDFHLYINGVSNKTSQIQARLYNLEYEIRQYEPKVVFIHIGICDCNPRLFTPYERTLISLFPQALSKRIVKFFSQRRQFFTKLRPKTEIPIESFRNYMRIIVEFIFGCGAHPVIINIIKPSLILRSRSYNFDKYVNAYNQILRNLALKNQCGYINLYKMTELHPEFLLNDGYHLTKAGHRALADLLFAYLEDHHFLPS